MRVELFFCPLEDSIALQSTQGKLRELKVSDKAQLTLCGSPSELSCESQELKTKFKTNSILVEVLLILCACECMDV